MWDVREAAEVLEAKLLRPMAPFTASGAGCDSRRIRPGDVFVAIRGRVRNGQEFLPEAYARGAVGALVAEDRGVGHNLILVSDPVQALWDLAAWRRGMLDISVVGVTGSFGKTTTKELVAAALSTRYRTYRPPENYNTEIGVPLSVLSIPDDAELAVFELGMTARGEIRKLAELVQPWAGIITAVGPAHLGALGSLEQIAEAKWELADTLPEEGLLVLGWDSPELRARVERCAGLCLRFGNTEEADFFPQHIVADDPTGVRFQAVGPGGGATVKLQLLGEHVAVLACGALALAWGMGIPEKSAAQALTHVPPVSHRLNLVQAPFGWVLDDCYNANPLSMGVALRTLRALRVPVARRVALLADMLDLGPDEERYHREAVEQARALGVDALFCYGPRFARAFGSWGGPGAAEEDDLEGLLSLLHSELWPGPCLLLVKGSRAMALERAVDYLLRSPNSVPPS